MNVKSLINKPMFDFKPTIFTAWFCPYCNNEVSGPDAMCCHEVHAEERVVKEIES